MEIKAKYSASLDNLAFWFLEAGTDVRQTRALLTKDGHFVFSTSKEVLVDFDSRGHIICIEFNKASKFFSKRFLKKAEQV